jgi:biotin synthase
LARRITEENFGKGVFVRALIEISSYCKNNCRYCGLRAANKDAVRYRLTKEDILECCNEAALLGFNTFVMQGGEDVVQNDEWIADVVRSIKELYPNKAVTLSLGERSDEGYALLRSAGADRYLLRHETACEKHYSVLHTATMSSANRKHCLFRLKELGFQVGSGMMVGSPGQSADELVEDLMFLDSLKPAMIGIGPFIPASGTPFANEKAGSVETVLWLISLLRLRFPKALIPATTALATLCENGTEQGVLAGANVVMPNVTPRGYAKNYTIYDNKKFRDSESAQQLELLEKKLNAIDRFIDYGRGDYKI